MIRFTAGAIIAMLLITSMIFMASLVQPNPALACVDAARAALFDEPTEKLEDFVVAQVRSTFSYCLVKNGVDIRTIPDFDILFPGAGLWPLE